MLQRVINIKNIGRFRNSTASPNPFFAKLTLVFGANAYGKSTFSTIMRSAQSGDVTPVLGRRTLGAQDEPFVHLLLTDGAVERTLRLHTGLWSSVIPQISVFDAVFVLENVHSGDVVDVVHRRNLFRVIVGQAGVALAEQERELADESRRKQTELAAAERAAQSFVPQGMRLATFIALPADADIDDKFAAQQLLVDALRQADAIRTRPALSPISISATIEDLEASLAKSLEGIRADAEVRFAAHLARHHMQKGGEQWLAEGIGYIVDDECPFCGRGDVDALPLVQVYGALFSDLYRGLQNEIKQVGQTMRAGSH